MPVNVISLIGHIFMPCHHPGIKLGLLGIRQTEFLHGRPVEQYLKPAGLFGLHRQGTAVHRADMEKVHGAIGNLHVNDIFDGIDLILPHVTLQPQGFRNDSYVVGRHTVENIASHRDGIRDTRSGLLAELLRKVIEDGLVIVVFIRSFSNPPTRVKPQDVLTVKTQVRIYHVRQLPVHPQRKEKQEGTGKTLYHEQPRMGTPRAVLSEE